MASPAGGLLRRVQWPLVLLLASVTLTGAAAIDAYRTVRSQQRVADGALHDYAHFAVWSYQQHLREAVARTVRQALGPVYHGHYLHTERRYPPVAELPRYLSYDPICDCRRASDGPSPVIYYGFVLNSDTVAAAVNPSSQPDQGWLAVTEVASAAPSPAVPDRQWVHDTITTDVHSGYRSDWGFTLLVAHRPQGPRALAYTLMPTIWGDTVIYAAEYTPSGMARLMSDAFAENGLLPATLAQSRPNGTLLWAAVRDPDGGTMFASDSSATWERDATARLPRSDAALEARVAIRPQLANTLVIGGLPRSRLPFLLTLLSLAAALSVVAVAQLRREGELTRLRADFVANVSHELRTPLAQIQLELETIQLGRAEPKPVRTAALARIARETRRLTYLADNILRFSRRDHATGLVDALPADIGALTHEIIAEFRPLALARQVVLRETLDAVPPVAVVPEGFRQILLNLLDNAIKYGPPGQTVRVSVATAGAVVRLTVTDEGPGVPASERESIWQPFVRGAVAGESAAGGAGIGLTIVRDVAAQHGGRAWVQPAGDHRVGATFVVEFPALGRLIGEPDGAHAAHAAAGPVGDGSAVARDSTEAVAGRRSLTGV
jgi:signal transduction histidine kinase